MICRLLCCFAIIGSTTAAALAQPPDGRPGGGAPGASEPGTREAGSRGPGVRGPGAFGPGAGGPGAFGARAGGPGGGGPGGRGARADEAFAKRLLTLDEDNDGGLSLKELLEHMRPHFASSDVDKNGRLAGDEVLALAKQFSRERLPPGGGNDHRQDRSGPADGRPDGRPDARGGRSPQGGPGGMRGGPEGMRGGPEPPSAADLVERAFSFDADHDGRLDRDEMRKFAEEMIARRGQGRGGQGPSGMGPGGMGPGGIGRDGMDRRRPGESGRGAPGTRGGAPEGARPRRPVAE